MKLNIGDNILATDVYGKELTGKIEKINEHTLIVTDGTNCHVVRKKEIIEQGDTIARPVDVMSDLYSFNKG